MKYLNKYLLGFAKVIAKNSSLAVTLLSLIVPIVLLYGASQFTSASMQAIVLFGVLGVSALLYSAWVFYSFNEKFDAKTEKDN